MKPWKKVALLGSSSLFLLTGCFAQTKPETSKETFPCASYKRDVKPSKETILNNPIKISEEGQKQYNAVYEIFVSSFNDTNNDGIGDIKGITEKLDYIKELGFSAIWLTPVHPSPTYHKYDVADYRAIDPQFGTLSDYEQLISEAHKRDMRVVQDLVINHVSTEHQWFKDLQEKGKESQYCSYFVLKQKDVKYRKSGASWYGLGKDDLNYYASFWEKMPELRLGNPDVQNAIDQNIAFWQQKGVDGFRLDAAGVYFSSGEYPNDYEANQYDAVNVVKHLHAEALKRNPNTYFVTETWETSEFVAPFFAAADSSFNFDLAKSTLSSVRSTSAEEYKTAYKASQNAYEKIHKSYADATFLTNHDQDRVASILPTIQEQKMAASILLTTPGVPYVYYGEEIGMKGVKPDESIREPMKWNKTQFTNPTIWKNGLQYNKELPSLQEQMNDGQSLYTHYKNMLKIRKQLGDMQYAKLTFINVDPNVLAYQVNNKLVIHNLSDKTKTLSNDILLKIKQTLLEGAKIQGNQIELAGKSTFVAELNN